MQNFDDTAYKMQSTGSKTAKPKFRIRWQREESQENFDRLMKAFYSLSAEKTGLNQRVIMFVTTKHFTLNKCRNLVREIPKR